MALDTIAVARAEIAQIYIAAFNRVPDAAGLSNWLNQYTAGLMTYAQIAEDFTNQAEYQAKYPALMTNTEYVTEIYQNVFGRTPDAGGLTNWTNQLDHTSITGINRGNIMKLMLDAAGATGNTDGVRLDNQASFAIQSILDGVDTDAATAQLANITSDAATVTAAQASIANMVRTFSLTTDRDVETANIFNSYNDFVPGTGYVNTLNDNDVLTGTGDNPTLNIEIGASNDTSEDAVIQPTMTNIEIVNVEFTDGEESTLNLRDASGITTVNVERITDGTATASITEMDASAVNLSLEDSINTGTITYSHKEEVLTGTNETLNFTATDSRANALSLVEAGDGSADTGFYFETVNVATTGNNDFDAMTIQANGREDLLLDQATNTTTQTINFTANGTPATGSLEINALAAAGAETITIVANARVDIAKDKEVALDDSNDGIATADLETLTITGAANVMIDGLDTTKQLVANGTKTLTVDASAMTGNLKLGVASAADAELSSALATRGDIDLSVTSGSGNDEIRTYSNLAGTITTNDGDDTVAVRNTTNTANADMEGVSAISTGAGVDTISANDMLAFGDTPSLNSGVDDAATIDSGSGNDTVTVAAMNSAVNWDDNNPNDNNVDDRYAMVGASVQTGEGDDTLNISGAMAENTDVDTGAGVDTVVYTVGALGTALAGDTNSLQEFVAVDSSTAAVDASTLDLDGAVMLTGEGDDTLTFNDADLAETGTTLVAVGDTTRDGAGAKINMGTGTDVLTLNTTDTATVVGATVYTSTTSFNTAALITGVETMNLNILNSVDAATTTATGVTQNETADMNNTAVTLDVMRVGSELATLNLTSQEKALMTLTGSEQYESGDDTVFTVNNMRSSVAMTLSAFDATAVVGATNALIATAAFADDGAIDVDAQAIAATTIDTTLALNFQVSDADADNDAFTLNITDGTYGDERDSGMEGYDLSLTLGTTNQVAAWTTATSTTDDNDLVIENLTLALDGKSHLINLNGFGDAQQTDARANQVNAIATSLTVTGSADNAKVDLYNVTADTITANIAADVDLYVGALSNKYTITTGSGNDNIDMTNDLVTANMTAVTGDEKDTVAAGTGTDRLIINGSNDLLGVGTSSTEGDPFASITGVEILRIDADTGATNANDITFDDTAMATGIGTLEIQGSGDQSTTLVLSDGYDRNLEIKSGAMTLAADNTASLDADADNRYAARTAEATYFSIDSQDALLDTDTSNLTVTMGLEEGSELHFVNSGLNISTVTLNIITANEAQATVIRGMSDDVNSTNDLAAGTTYSTVGDQMLISKTTGGDIDVINVLEAESDDATLTDDDAAITLTVSDTWAATAMTINASGILDTDTNAATGGVTVDGSMEATAALTINGGANSDTLIGGNGSDVLTGNAGNDTLVGDNTDLVVVEGVQSVQTVTFHDDTAAENGDTYTFTVGNKKMTYVIGDHKYTMTTDANNDGDFVDAGDIATATVTGYSDTALVSFATNSDTMEDLMDLVVTAFHNTSVDADADADVTVAKTVNADPTADVLTITGSDTALDNNDYTAAGAQAALGETIVVTSSAANSVAAKEIVTLNFTGKTWNIGETITVDVNGGVAAGSVAYLVGDTDGSGTIDGAEVATLGTVVSATDVAAGIAAMINGVDVADSGAIVDASAALGVLTLQAEATGNVTLFADTSATVSGEADRAQVNTYDISALVEDTSALTVTVNGNTWTSAAWSGSDDDGAGPDTAASEALDLSDMLNGLQAWLRAAGQMNNNNIVVAATDADTFTISGATGTGNSFTAPSFSLVNSAGTITNTNTSIAIDQTASTMTKTVAAGVADIMITQLGTGAGAEVNQQAISAVTTAAVAAVIGDSNVDTLNGGEGNDTLIGGGGADIINGGNGTDTASYVNSSAAVTVSLALATAQVSTGEASGDVLSSIENLTGSAFADTLTGDAGVNVLTGNAGADVFNYTSLATASAQTGITLATADTIADFATTSDTIKFGTAGTALNYVEAGAAADFATALANATTAMNGTVAYYLTSTAADGGLLFADSNLDGTADAVIKMTGITQANFAFSDIIA